MSSARRNQSRLGPSTSALTVGECSGRAFRTVHIAPAEMSPLMLMPEELGLGRATASSVADRLCRLIQTHGRIHHSGKVRDHQVLRWRSQSMLLEGNLHFSHSGNLTEPETQWQGVTAGEKYTETFKQ